MNLVTHLFSFTLTCHPSVNLTIPLRLFLQHNPNLSLKMEQIYGFYQDLALF